MIQIEKSTLSFLEDLSKNNNREWFTANKPVYQEAHLNMSEFVDALILEMNQHDEITNTSGKASLFRIYKDVRFSKEKIPYNTHFSFSLSRKKPELRGGYYMRLSPGKCALACGFFNPSPEDLKTIRFDMMYNQADWEKLTQNPQIKKNFGSLEGEKLVSAPRGFDKNHPAIDLIRHKQFLFSHNFTDQEVLKPDFLKTTNEYFKAIRPFFDYMSMVLTSNSNGESTIE